MTQDFINFPIEWKLERTQGRVRTYVPGLVISLKMDSTMTVTSSSLMGLRASSLLGVKSVITLNFMTPRIFKVKKILPINDN